MKKLKHIVFFLVLIGLLPALANSQSIERQVINFNGGTTQIENMVISYALGETVISTIVSNNNIFTQGFFQPDKTIVGTFSIAEEDLEMKIFPNPTNSQLNIDLSSPTIIKNLEVQVFNYLGQAVSPIKKVNSPSSQTIDCEQLPAGYYFLNIKDIHHQQNKLSFVKID